MEVKNGDKSAAIQAHGTIHADGLKNWPAGIVKIIQQLDYDVPGIPELFAVEQISWYGKRKGSLQLAHLAGAIYGAYVPRLKNEGAAIKAVMLFRPDEVKKASIDYPAPTDFNEHEADALSLCRLALQRANEDTRENKEVVANSKAPSNRRRR